MRTQNQPGGFDDGARTGIGDAWRFLAVPSDEAVIADLPSCATDIQVLRSSLYHSTDIMPPSAWLSTMPLPWNWKPHFWMTRREATFMTRQRRIDLVDIAGAESHVCQRLWPPSVA